MPEDARDSITPADSGEPSKAAGVSVLGKPPNELTLPRIGRGTLAVEQAILQA